MRRPVLQNKCFRCIRDTPFVNEYEWSYECAWEVMEKMTIDEVNELAQEILDFVRAGVPDDMIDLAADSYARVFLYTVTHGEYLRGAYEKVPEVRKVLRLASDTSIPAWGVCELYEGTRPMPRCWLDKTCETR